VTLGTCTLEDCTAAETGKCVLSKPTPENCDHFVLLTVPTEVVSKETIELDQANDLIDTPVNDGRLAEAGPPGRKFRWGNELGKSDAIPIMRSRYSHLIGVLGTTDAGKTCFLCALYLMASNGILPKPFKFSGSLTLQAFEDRARGLREWQDGVLPGQLVDHTFLADPRQPSLLHLGIRESDGNRERFDLLLTDLPGEWTDNLVNNAKHSDSFRFLQRADGIILVIDGNRLVSDERHVELQRMRYFCDRLATDVSVSSDTPFVILVSKGDEIDMKMPVAAKQLEDYVRSLGFPVTTILAAALSRKPDQIPSGTGIFDAVEAIIRRPASNQSARSKSRQPTARTFQEFKS
jgi:hypothetical protein